MTSRGDNNQQGHPMKTRARTLRRSIKAHCYQSNPQLAAAQLILWGNLMCANRAGVNRSCTNLLSLSQLFKSEQAVKLLKELDRSLYGQGAIKPLKGGEEDWLGKKFWKSMAPHLTKAGLKSCGHESRGLPPLYSLD